MIEGIAKDLDIRRGKDHGTDVVMSLDLGRAPPTLNGSASSGAAPAERIVRRIVAVVAAQTDMPSDRLVESLLAVELAARHAPQYLIGHRIQLSLERLGGGFDLRLGPLHAHGADALVRDSEVPVIGAVIERLSDHMAVEATDHETGAERLWLRMEG